MAARKAMRGVLGNFLGTYTSRYCEYDGYWLFGFLADDLGELRIDLLASTIGEPDSPLGVAVRLAAARFNDQMNKAGVAGSQVREAWLTIRKLPEPVEGPVNGRLCMGHNVSLVAAAVMDDGRRYEHERVVFVAPHNPEIELRTARV